MDNFIKVWMHFRLLPSPKRMPTRDQEELVEQVLDYVTGFTVTLIFAQICLKTIFLKFREQI